MNRKDITDVNKIVTNGLDINGNKIIGIGEGTENSDAVNKAQLDALKSEIQSKITALSSSVNTNTVHINLCQNSPTKSEYYYFTDQLRHDNNDTVKFPAVDSYPFSADNNSEFFKIELDGHYQIIYTDFYSGDHSQFIIYDDTNGNDLLVNVIDDSASWLPIIINAVIVINTDNGFGHVKIKMYMKPLRNVELDGVGYSTFYIKYLHS